MGSEASTSKPVTEINTVDASHIRLMDQKVSQRVRQGVQYNMKIGVCGKRGTGKTNLFRRFQGRNYEPKVFLNL